jgi:hypothetical protein
VRNSEPLPPTPEISSSADFVKAIHWGVQQAFDNQARRLLWLDPHFSDWPLSSAALIADLQAWLALPQRQLLMVALDYQAMQLRHARFVSWRRDRSHQVDLLTPAHEDRAELPTLALDDKNTCVQLFDRVHWAGRCGSDARETRRLNQQFDALVQRSGTGFPVTTLGL